MYYFANVEKTKGKSHLVDSNYNISQDAALAVLSLGLVGAIPDAVVFREVLDSDTVKYHVEAPQEEWDKWRKI
jgi:hypothetical protein